MFPLLACVPSRGAGPWATRAALQGDRRPQVCSSELLPHLESPNARGAWRHSSAVLWLCGPPTSSMSITRKPCPDLTVSVCVSTRSPGMMEKGCAVLEHSEDLHTPSVTEFIFARKLS